MYFRPSTLLQRIYRAAHRHRQYEISETTALSETRCLGLPSNGYLASVDAQQHPYHDEQIGVPGMSALLVRISPVRHISVFSKGEGVGTAPDIALCYFLSLPITQTMQWLHRASHGDLYDYCRAEQAHEDDINRHASQFNPVDTVTFTDLHAPLSNPPLSHKNP